MYYRLKDQPQIIGVPKPEKTEKKPLQRIVKFGKTSFSKLVKQADDLFRALIRKRDSDKDGFAICFTCANSAHYSQMEVGHFVPRICYQLRWNQQNAHLQCKECNNDRQGNLFVYAIRIDARYGAGTADRLTAICKQTIKFDRSDLQELINTMK